jgi:hypothetical protein
MVIIIIMAAAERGEDRGVEKVSIISDNKRLLAGRFCCYCWTTDKWNTGYKVKLFRLQRRQRRESVKSVDGSDAEECCCPRSLTNNETTERTMLFVVQFSACTGAQQQQYSQNSRRKPLNK